MGDAFHIEPQRDVLSNVLMGVTLVGRTRRARPRLELQSLPAKSMFRVALGEKPVLWARIENYGWWWAPAEPVTELLPPIRADRARKIAELGQGTEAWWVAWMRALAPSIAPLVLAQRGARVDLVPLDTGRADYAFLHDMGDRVTRTDREADWQPWDLRAPPVLPLHSWPEPSDGRVRAWRKRIREGATAPVVLRWCSALMTHLVLDGHARFVAAELEGVRVPRLVVTAAHTRLSQLEPDRHARLEASLPTLERLGSSAVAAVNHVAITLAVPITELRAIDRAAPIPGGERAWRREVRARLQGEPRPLAAAMLAREVHPRGRARAR